MTNDTNSTTSPAMNTASPTAPAVCEGCNGYGMVGNILDTDTCPFCGGSGEVTVLEGSGPDTYEMPANCSPCNGTGAIIQGSATSGDAALIAELDWCIAEGHIGPRSKTALIKARAALAASAEQSNAPVPRVGGNTWFRKASEFGPWIECDSNAPGAIRFAPVAERAAAPASVPEGWRETLKNIVEWLESSAQSVQTGADEWRPASQFDYELGHAAAEITALLAAAPEVAQPAAQGELPPLPASGAIGQRAPLTHLTVEQAREYAREWGASQRQEGRREASFVVAALEGLAKHVRAIPLYSRLLGDMDAVDKAIAILATPAPTAGEAQPDVAAQVAYSLYVNECAAVGQVSASYEGFRAVREQSTDATDAAISAQGIATQGGKEGAA